MHGKLKQALCSFNGGLCTIQFIPSLLAQLCFGSADIKNPMLDFWFATGKGWTQDTQLRALWSCRCRPHQSVYFNNHKQYLHGMLLILFLLRLCFLLFVWFQGISHGIVFQGRESQGWATNVFSRACCNVQLISHSPAV